MDLNFKKKDKAEFFLRKIILSIPFLCLLFIIFITFTISTLRIFFEGRKIRKDRIVKEENIKKEKEKNTELSRNLLEMQDAEGAEKILREKLQVKKPEEEMVMIINPKPEEPQNTDEKKGNFIQRFFRKIFKGD